MSKESWDKSWGKLMPLIQTPTKTKKENQILDQKVLHAISQVLAAGADINDTSPILKCTILHLCIGKGLPRSSKFIIENGANVHTSNLFHETPDKYISHAPYNRERLEKLFLSTKILISQKTER